MHLYLIAIELTTVITSIIIKMMNTITGTNIATRFEEDEESTEIVIEVKIYQ